MEQPRVREQLIALFELQKLDLIVRKNDQERDALPASLREAESRTQQTRSQLETCEAQGRTQLEERRTLEAHIQAENIKLRKWESRLNEIRNQREYLALSREIEASKRGNKEAEERLQLLRREQESLETQTEALRAQLADLETEVATERTKLSEATQATLVDSTQLIAKRETLVAELPKALIRTYERIRAKRMGVGVVAAAGGSCTGCNIRLPPQLFNVLQRVSSIEQCPSCLRLMIWKGVIDAHMASEETPDIAATTDEAQAQTQAKATPAASA